MSFCIISIRAPLNAGEDVIIDNDFSELGFDLALQDFQFVMWRLNQSILGIGDDVRIYQRCAIILF